MTKLNKRPSIDRVNKLKKSKQTGVNTSRDYHNFMDGRIPGLVDDKGNPVNQ